MDSMQQLPSTPLSAAGVVYSYTANRMQSQAANSNGLKASSFSEDIVTISKEAHQKFSALDERKNPRSSLDIAGQPSSLSEQELLELQKLHRRDAEVRRHEQAHLAAAGQYARGGTSFTYERGPDGASYAVAGKVGIDLSKEQRPEATIRKMQTVRRAALAPMSPSATDRSIAARASTMESQARQELLLQEQMSQTQMISASRGDVRAADPDENILERRPSPRAYMVQQMLAAYKAASHG